MFAQLPVGAGTDPTGLLLAKTVNSKLLRGCVARTYIVERLDTLSDLGRNMG